MTNIRVKGLKRLISKIDNLQDLNAVRAGLMAGGVHIKAKVAEYPAQKRLTRREVFGQTFASRAQRAYVMAAIRAGEIPYRRGQSSGSERHGQSWTIRTQNGGLIVIVGSDTSYGPFLQDERRQSLYHEKVGWKTTDTVVSEEGKEVARKIRDQIRKAIG